MFEELGSFFITSRAINICNFLAGYFGLCSGLAKSAKVHKLNRYLQLVFVTSFMSPVYFLFHLGMVLAAIPALNVALEFHYHNYSVDGFITLAVSIPLVFILIRCRDGINTKARDLMTKDNTYLALGFIAVVFLALGTLVIPEFTAQ